MVLELYFFYVFFEKGVVEKVEMGCGLSKVDVFFVFWWRVLVRGERYFFSFGGDIVVVIIFFSFVDVF